MESIKLKNKYIDTEGVYDSNEGETQDKINRDLQFVDNLDIRTPLMYLCDVGYYSVQGLCCVQGQYIIVGRYTGAGGTKRDLMVFDIVQRKVIKSNIFFSSSVETGKNVDLGHLSSITYVRVDGTDYLYVPRKENNDILRLTFNTNTGDISLDTTFSYSAPDLSNTSIPYRPLCLAYAGGDFYFIASGTYKAPGTNDYRCYIYKISDNFNETTLAFTTNFGGVDAGNFARQGFTSDGKYLYFSLSDRFNVPRLENESGHQYLMRATQEIIITDLNGTVVKSLSFPRGEYGEIEDIDLITPDGSITPSIVIACNRNDGNSNFVPIYACPLYRNSKKSFYLLTQDSEGSLLRDYERYGVYCDSSPCYIDTSGNPTDNYNVLNSNPFATGLIQDKFTSIPAAIGYIKKLGFPVTLYISGKHGNMTYRGLRGINFIFDGNNTDGEAVNTVVGDITIVDSYGISLTFENGAEHGAIDTGNSILYDDGNGNITVDSDFSSTSENPVQNKVIKTAMDAKADKVANATNENFAALDANGNLIDSGHKHSDYLTQHQSLAAYRTSADQNTIDAGKVNTSDYNPYEKTSAMTKRVGKDSSGRLWTEPVESLEVASATGNWLSENITQETGYVIDDSLSVTGAAADAKAVGDKLKATGDELEAIGDELSDLKSTVDADYTALNDNKLLWPAMFERGGLSNTGGLADQPYRIRSIETIVFDTDTTFNIAEGFQIKPIRWNRTTGELASSKTYFSGQYTFTNSYTYKVVIARVTEDTEEIADITTFAKALYRDLVIPQVNQNTLDINTLKNSLGQAYELTTGSYTNTQWQSSYYSVIIPVKPNSSLKVISNTTNKSILMGLKSFNNPSPGDAPDFSTTPDWTKSISIASGGNVFEGTIPSDVNFLYVYAGANENAPALPTSIIINNFDYRSNAFDNLIALSNISKYENVKTIAFMGDSITAGVATGKCYHQYISDVFGFVCLNFGYGGSGYYKSTSTTSSGKLGLGQPGIGVNITSENYFVPNNILARLPELANKNVDCIVIFAGTNDWNANVTVENFRSAIDDAFEYCKTNYQHIPVIVMTPIRRRYDTVPNSNGQTLRDFADIIIEECIKYSIDYIDTMTVSELYPDNDENRVLYFANNPDTGLHPSSAGHKRIAVGVGERIERHIKYSDFATP